MLLISSFFFSQILRRFCDLLIAAVVIENLTLISVIQGRFFSHVCGCFSGYPVSWIHAVNVLMDNRAF